MSLPTKPGNTERGWNDPPVFLHNADGPPVTAVTPKRNNLNKRVGHTGLFADSTGSSSSNSNLAGGTDTSATNTNIEHTNAGGNPSPLCPPPIAGNTGNTGGGIILFPPTTTTDVPKYVAPIIVPNMSPTETDLPIIGSPTATNPVTNTQINIESEEGMPNFDDDEQMFHYVISKLQKTLLDVKRTLQPKIAEDVKKKLDILAGMWENGNLSYPVKSGMARLATALHKRNCDEAHKIHMALMMDSISEVGQWMVGVKRLIQEARTTQTNISPDTTSQGQTADNNLNKINDQTTVLSPVTGSSTIPDDCTSQIKGVETAEITPTENYDNTTGISEKASCENSANE